MNPFRTTIDHTRSLLGPANPVPGDVLTDSWSDPEGQAAYQRIVSTPAQGTPAAGQPGRRRPLAATVAATTVVVVAAGLLTVWLRPSGASPTATAPPLRYTLTGVSRPAAAVALPDARSVLLRLARVAASQPADPPPRGADVGYVLTNEWFMSTAVAGGVAQSTIIPHVDQTWSRQGGAVRQVQRTGRPVAAAVSSPRALSQLAGNAPSTVATYPPAAAAAGPSVRDLSLNPARLRAQLLHAFPYEHTDWPASYHLIRIITDLNHQVVPPALEATLWQVLAGQRDMQNMGTVTDRAGRPGDAVAFTDRQGVERLVLIISPSSGRLIGWEDMFLRNPGGLSITTYPAVIGYVSFLTNGWTTNMTTPVS